MNPIKQNLANAVTGCNVLCGSLAIICLATEYPSAAEALVWASVLIAVAAMADFADGFVARLTSSSDHLGKELDSLSDLVSFGVAPCVLTASCLRQCGAPAWLSLAMAVLPLAGAVRLAKFNVDTRQTTSFLGLPIPANAMFWIGYAAMLHTPVAALAQWWVLLPAVVLLSALMVSELPLLALKFKSYGWKGNEARWILVAGVVALVAALGVPGLMAAIVWYVAVSLCAKTPDNE